MSVSFPAACALRRMFLAIVAGCFCLAFVRAEPDVGPAPPVGRVLLLPTNAHNVDEQSVAVIERNVRAALERCGAVVEPVSIEPLKPSAMRDDWTLRAMREAIERDANGFALLELREDALHTTGTQATLTIWNKRYHRIEIGSGGIATQSHPRAAMNVRIARLLEGMKDTERIARHLREGTESAFAKATKDAKPLDLSLLLARRIETAEAAAKRAGGESIATWSYIFEQTRRMAALGKVEYALVTFEAAYANSGARPPIRVPRTATNRQRIESWESLLADLVHLRAQDSFVDDFAFHLQTHRKAMALLAEGRERDATQLLEAYRPDLEIVWEEARLVLARQREAALAAQGS